MPSTYTVNLGIEKPATGEQSGTWGDTTNVNFDILDQAINGAERVTLTSAGSSGSPNALQITNGATSDGRNKWLEFYSASDLGGSAFVQLDPNDAEKIVFVRNSLAGSQSLILFQGTYNAARDLEVPAGVDMVVKFDGGGASAATVTDVYNKLRVTELTTPTLTATTADINGGTLDNSVIGGTTAAAITGTTITANTSLNIAGDGATVTGIKDEDDMSSNSPTKLATQQSIKAYVDSQVGTVDTLAEILANGNTSGSNNLIIDNGQALTSNTINETTAGSGVTIDSVLLKDDVVNATDVETGSISANDGTAAATIANTTGNFTITNFISNSVDIGGGAIDGTNIGASSRGSGAFTTLSSNSTTTIAGAAKFTANVDTTSSTALELKVGKISAVPSDVTDAFVAIHDTGGPGSLAGDLVLVPRSSNGVDNAVRIYSGYTTPVERLAVGYSELAINDPGNDYDFRVESDSNTHMLFVDAGNDRLGINTSLPEAPVDFAVTSVQIRSDASGANEPKLIFNNDLFAGANHGFIQTSNGGLQLDFEGGSSSTFTGRAKMQLIGGGSRAISFSTSTDNGSTFVERFKITNTDVIANETGVDADFRVESDSNANMLFVDAGNNLAYVGSNTTTTTPSANGFGVKASGERTVVLESTAADTLLLFRDSGTTVPPYIGSFGNKLAISGYGGGTPDVGIGITAPQSALHISENGGPQTSGDMTTGLIVSNGTAGTAIQMGTNDASGFGYIKSSYVNSSETGRVLLLYTGTQKAVSVESGETVINDDSLDRDFRVESDGNANMLYVDAGSNEVGVGTSVPRRTFDVNGVSALGSGSNAVTIGADNGSALTHIANNTTPSTTVGAGGTLDITTCAGNNGFGEMMIGNSSSGGFAKVVFGYNMQPHIVVQNGTEFESIAYGGAVTSTKIALSWNNTNSILRVQCGASKTATINGFMQSISTPT